MSSGPKKIENRGGARPGAGRKPKYTLSESQIKAMLRKANRYKKEHGKDLDEVLLDFIYGVPQLIDVPEHEMLVPVRDEEGHVTGKEVKKIDAYQMIDIPGIRERIASLKIFKDFTMPKITEGGNADKSLGGPGLYLPESDPDPAGKVVPIDKQVKEG